MPNECINNVKLVATKQTLDEIEKSKFSFNYFIPAPENATREWLTENWCADREAKDIELEREDEETLYVKYTTTYTLPITFLKKLVEKFPELYIFNQYAIEYTDNGIVILYMDNDEVKEKEFKWFDPPNLDYVKGVRDGGGWC